MPAFAEDWTLFDVVLQHNLSGVDVMDSRNARLCPYRYC